MAHIVVCLYCKEKFDTELEPFVKPNRTRYAHKRCADKREAEKTQEERDKEALEKYIMKLLDEPYLSARVKKQIKDYQEQYKYTYSGMLKSLIWFYEIKGNSTEKANGGIGIIPFIYKDACNYYYNLYLAQEANENKEIKKQEIKEITITSPQAERKKIKLFSFENEDPERRNVNE